jgi:dephospho-CoA kinase
VPLPLRIGLTGGIGSGKSTAAAIWVRHGAALIDTDAIARHLTAAGGAAMPALREAFGASIVAGDGALNRPAMRSLAFSDTQAKQRLEAVLHPLIGAQAQREADTAASGVLVFDVPLLTESALWRARVDRVLVIDCSEATQIERVIRRNGWTRDAAARAIANQASRAARCAIADATIFNDGIDPAELDAAIDTLWHLWQPLTQNPVEQ